MTRKSTINRTVFLMLPLFGVLPGRSCILITRIFWVVSIGFVEYCHYRYFVTHLNSENFFNLVDCLCSFLAYAKVMIKFFAFWMNQRKLREILALITNDWDDCANSDIGVRMATGKAKISDRITNVIFFLHTLSIVGYCIGVFMASFMVDVTDQTIELPLANKLDFPFSINTQRMYRFVLILQFLHMTLGNWAAGITNAMLLSLVLHVGGQIDILQYWLEQLTIKEIGNKQEQSVIMMTKKIILKHQKIINFSEIIESLYTYIALMLFASNTIMICSIGFLIVSAIGTPDASEQIMKCLLFFTITNLEAFIFCYAGEYLNNKSKAIGFATYNCAWYNLNPKINRILLFIISRSQKQLTLTAGKMMDLTLESFASIMNASGSYLSVMLAAQ